MVQWLKEKFEAWIGIIVVLTVIFFGISGGITGITLMHNNSVIGFFIGALLGVLIGLIFCIIAYGLVATVVYIANSTDANIKFLSEIKSKLNDIENIKNQMTKLDEISLKLDYAKNSSSNTKTESSNSPDKKEPINENFNTSRIGNKIFAIKNSEPGKYFCPKCHAQVAETAFSCSNCNKSLVAD